MRDAFIARLGELAAKDPRIMLITGDLGFKVLDEYAEKFPRQFLNVGVAEQNMTGVATGLAIDGRIVFTYSIGNFPTLRTLEQLRNGPCYHNLNVKVVCIGGGLSYGPLGFSHHATEDLAIMRSLPSTTVVAPGELWEAKEATEAVVSTPGVCYLRVDKSQSADSNRVGEKFQLGKARLLRDGKDVTLVATGGILGEAVKAGELLAQKGIQARILSFHTLKPVDRDSLVRAAKETGGIVTIEEHSIQGGLGGVVAEELMELGALPRKFWRIGLRDGFSTAVGSQAYLRQRYGMDAVSIVSAVEKLLG